MSCETFDAELIVWMRQEISDLRERVRELEGKLLDARVEAADMRGRCGYWRQVAERRAG